MAFVHCQKNVEHENQNFTQTNCYFSFIVFSNAILFAQTPPLKQWDKTFGGSSGDNLFSLQQTTDGGYIFGGISASGISGDKN